VSKQTSPPPRVRLGYGGGGPLTGESARQTRSTVGRLFLYARPYTWQLILVSMLVVVGTAASLAGPILFGQAIDQNIIPGDRPGLLGIVLAMLGIYLGGGLAALLYGVMMVRVAQRLVADVRAELFNHLQTLSMAYHDRHRVGDLMSRVSNDTEAINRVLSNGLVQFITNILMLGGIMVSMFLLNWQLAVAGLPFAKCNKTWAL
jgi:ABC-type multidrug transport system fused ATPase/permease subunit